MTGWLAAALMFVGRGAAGAQDSFNRKIQGQNEDLLVAGDRGIRLLKNHQAILKDIAAGLVRPPRKLPRGFLAVAAE